VRPVVPVAVGAVRRGACCPSSHRVAWDSGGGELGARRWRWRSLNPSNGCFGEGCLLLRAEA
jgi:hypothetical protein